MDYLILNGNRVSIKKDKLYVNDKLQKAELGSLFEVAGCKLKLLYNALELVEINSHKLVFLDETGDSTTEPNKQKETSEDSIPEENLIDEEEPVGEEEGSKKWITHVGSYNVNGVDEQITANLIIDGIVEVNGVENTVIQTKEEISGIPTWHILGDLRINGVDNTIKYIISSKKVVIKGIENKLKSI